MTDQITQDSVKALADGLTVMCRDALTFRTEINGQFRITPNRLYPATIAALERRGMIDDHYFLTPLGLAVKAHIQGNSHD